MIILLFFTLLHYLVPSKMVSMKHSNDTIGNRTRDTPAYIAVPRPTAPPRSFMFDIKIRYISVFTASLCVCVCYFKYLLIIKFGLFFLLYTRLYLSVTAGHKQFIIYCHLTPTMICLDYMLHVAVGEVAAVYGVPCHSFTWSKLATFKPKEDHIFRNGPVSGPHMCICTCISKRGGTGESA